MRMRRRTFYLIIAVTSGAVSALGVVITRPRPPVPSMDCSLVGELESGDGAHRLGIRALFGPPDPGAFVCVIDWPTGSLEVRPPGRLRRGGADIGPLSAGLLHTELGLAPNAEGRGLAADLEEILRGFLVRPPSEGLGVPRTPGDPAAGAGRWYESVHAIQLYPAGTPRPRQ